VPAPLIENTLDLLMAASPAALQHAFKNGVDDLILLDQITEQAIVDTLKTRYTSDLIYVRQLPASGNIVLMCI
jgi:myosin heavy subunit